MPESSTGVFVGTDGDRAIVRLDDGQEKSLRIVGSYMPQQGDVVRISRDRGGTVVDGLATPRQPLGTILTVESRAAGPTSVLVATVRTVDDKTVQVEVLDHITDPAPGDSVVVLAGYVIGRRRVPTTKEN